MAEITLTLSEALTRALALQQAGDLEQAEQIYRKIINAKPDHFDALYWLGLACYQHGHHKEADRLIERAIAQKPDYAEAYHNRRNALRDLKRLDEALASYDKAVVLKPDLENAKAERLLTKLYLCDWTYVAVGTCVTSAVQV